jgi:hypothetical protein
MTRESTASILLIPRDDRILWANRTAIDQSPLAMDETVGSRYAKCQLELSDPYIICSVE